MIQAAQTEILSILSSGDSQIIIPKYQRDYAWGKEQIEEFMADIINAKDTKEKIFLGTFVFTKDNNQLSVIDGQQRITTIALVLIACRDLAKSLGNFALAAQIQNKLTFVSQRDGKSHGARIVASPSIRKLFDIMCEDSWSREFPDKLPGVDGRTFRAQKNKLRSVYDYAAKQLNGFSQEHLSDFLDALYGAYVVRIDVDSMNDAFSIFERTNARGLELNAADLTKNSLFQSLDSTDVEDKWVKVVDNAEGGILRMLKYYWVAHRGYISQSDLYRKLKARGVEIGPAKILDEILDFSRFFNAALSRDPKDIEDWLREIGCNEIAGDQSRMPKISGAIWALRLFKVTQPFPVIYSGIHLYARSDKTSKDINTLINFIEAIEKYHFINSSICERPGNEVEKLYAESAAKFAIESSKFSELASEFIERLHDKRAHENEFIEGFTELAYEPKNLPLLYYVFDRMNNVEAKGGQVIDIYNPDDKIIKRNYNIEHFFPQNPKNEVSDSLQEKINNIGNLIIISRHTNSFLGNKTPIEKISILGDSKHTQSLVLVQHFVEKYGNKAGDWNEDTITQRAEEMAKLSYNKVWRF